LETFQSHIEKILSQLIILHGLQDRGFEIHRVLKILTAECLAYPLGLRPPKKFSRICSDGTPIEFSVSISAGPSALRYVTEITDASLSIYDRLTLSKQRTPIVLNTIGGKNTKWLTEAYNVFFPDGEPIPEALNFGVWYGVAHSLKETLIKLYFNIRWRASSEAWKCFELLLQNLRQEVLSSSISANSLLRSRGQPVAVGLELKGSRIEAIKIYFRVFGLSTLDVEKLLELLNLPNALDSFLEFDRIMLNGPRKYLDSVIFSVRFPTKESKPISAKFEVAAAKYLPNDRLIRDKLFETIPIFGYNKNIYEGTLQVLSNGRLSSTSVRSHTVIGVGLSEKGNASLKVYIKPQLW